MTRDELAALDAKYADCWLPEQVEALDKKLKHALWVAYRSGQLVMVPSVDDLIGVISDGHILVSDGRYRAFARAVLTSMGAKTDG